MGQKVGKCYLWHESTAKRGANEVASCVYDFIKDQSSKGVQTINLYSDNCGGQNRNRIVFMMYLIAAKKFNVNISHKFLEKGHTQNENDSIHALIERSSKNKEIYTPDQWFALVRWAKDTGNPYIVKEVSIEDILDFKKLLAGKNWTKDERNLKVMWSRVREIGRRFKT
ncbi:unnamed protein product [Euphydryas editha]|uniref:DUF7869 domain-containing protein n=1 Tax=Euphydryas editha TaxID=104508 RepID=A0AAU9U0X1_EUPED|nr:unnamed protein product [Euphydryas editha]